MLDNNIDLFYKEYKDIFNIEVGNEPTTFDILTEISELCVKYNLDDKDVLKILENYDIKFDYRNFLRMVYDDWYVCYEPEIYYCWFRKDDGDYSQTKYSNLEEIDDFEKEEARKNNWKLVKIEEIPF